MYTQTDTTRSEEVNDSLADVSHTQIHTVVCTHIRSKSGVAVLLSKNVSVPENTHITLHFRANLSSKNTHEHTHTTPPHHTPFGHP